MKKPFMPKFKTPTKFWKAKILNDRIFTDYLYRLEELYISMFKWNNLPDTVDERFIELTLCEYGQILYFNDNILGDLCLTMMNGGPLNVYRIPIWRRAYANNGYQATRTQKDSVIIFNNFLHRPAMETIILYAQKLYEIDRTIQVNVNAQKTPVSILCNDEERLTYKNIYEQYEGNTPVILGNNNLDLKNVSVLNTNAPYVGDKLQILKRQIWNECLTFFGIENNNSEKKERLVTDETESNLAHVYAQRNVMLASRKQAAEQINKMFGTNISVEFRTYESNQNNMEGDKNGSLYN